MIKKKIADISGVPSEVLLGVPLLTAVGKQELFVSNYHGILEYSEEIIRIQSKIGQIKIIGTKLYIEYYLTDEMKISGNITEIYYE